MESIESIFQRISHVLWEGRSTPFSQEFGSYYKISLQLPKKFPVALNYIKKLQSFFIKSCT